MISRPDVSNVNGAGVAKAFGLNQYRLRLALPKSFPGRIVWPLRVNSEPGLMPVASARWVMRATVDRFGEVTLRFTPDWNTVMMLSCQPPASRFAGPPRERKRLPLPNGSS